MMQEKDMPKADFITSIILIAFSIGVIIMSIQMPRFEHRGAHPLSAPGIVPGVLGFIIGLFGISLFVRSLRQGGHRLGLSKDKFINWLRKPATLRLLLTIALTLIYAWGLIGRIYFPLATFLFIASFIIIFEYDRHEERNKKVKRIGIALLIALLASASISALFQYGFLVRLP